MTATSTRTATGTRSNAAIGLIVFAGTMMMLVGVFQALQGFAGILSDEFYVTGARWTFAFDITVWGWIHLIVGIVIALAGVAVMRGVVWGRTVGVLLAALSAVLCFAWLPYYPVWGLLIIALNVFVIWALITHGRDVVA